MYVSKYGDKYRFYKRYVIDGVARRVSVVMDRDTPQSRAKAEAILDGKIPKSISTDIAFSEMVELYIEDQKITLKQSTWARNQNLLTRIGKEIGRKPLSDLNAGTIRAALLRISKNPTTLNSYLTRLKAAIRWAYQNDMIESLSCIDKIKPWADSEKKSRIEGRYLEKHELRAVLDHQTTDEVRLVIEFLALTGMRVGEMIALNKEDVTADEIRITKTFDSNHDVITTAKTSDSNRTITVQPELKPVIARINQFSNANRIRSRSRVPYFFVSSTGSRLSYSYLSREIGKVTEAVAGRRLTAHALRHTHASLLAEQGIPLETISRRLGHSDSRITREIYLHVTEKMKEKDRNLLAKTRLFG